MSEPREPWHLDKRVPIALIAAIIVQTVTIVWWAASIDARVIGHDRRIERIETTIERARENDSALIQRVTRMEERLDAMLAILRDVQTQLRPQRN